MVLLRPKTVLSVYSDHTFAGRNFRFLEEEVHKTVAGTLDLFARGRWPALHLSGNEQTEGDKHREHNKPAGPSIGTKAISESSDKRRWTLLKGKSYIENSRSSGGQPAAGWVNPLCSSPV